MASAGIKRYVYFNSNFFHLLLHAPYYTGRTSLKFVSGKLRLLSSQPEHKLTRLTWPDSIKPASNDINASYLPTSGVDPCRSQATATLRTQPFDWEGAGTVTFSWPWALHRKAPPGDTTGCISIKSGDSRTSDKGCKGTAIPVTMLFATFV